MEFRFTSDDEELLAYAGQSIRKVLPLERFRSASSTVNAWSALATDGWLDAATAPADGGAALPLSTVAAIARIAGSVAAGEEFVQNAWLIPQLCSVIQDESECLAWRAAHLARPGFVWPVPVAGSAPEDEAAALAWGAHREFDRYRLEGLTRDDERTLLTRTSAGGHAIRYLGGLSTSTGAVEATDDCKVTTSTVDVELDLTHWRAMRAGALVLRSAALAGTAFELLRRTVAYVSERIQFGQPIGQFQAVKHICADVHTELEVAWLGVLYATLAWEDDAAAVAAARAQTAAAALSAARAAAQLHGGMGFTWESDLHWLMKAALDGQTSEPTSASASHEIGEMLVRNA